MLWASRLNKSRNYLGVFLVFLIVVTVLLLYILRGEKAKTIWPNFNETISINDKQINVAIANTPSKIERGFMGIREIPQDSGIFYTFEYEDIHCFSMYNIAVKLSIAFIKSDLEIVQITDMESYDMTKICPKEKILYALQVSRGFFEQNNIKEKDKVIIKNKLRKDVWPNFNRVVKINDKTINVAVADTYAKRQRGFMHVEKIPEDSGIIFIFEKEDINCFWMFNTPLKLSIAFINSDKEIVEIYDMDTCEGELDCYQKRTCPKTKILYALEVNRGYFKKNNIKEKDRIVLH